MNSDFSDWHTQSQVNQTHQASTVSTIFIHSCMDYPSMKMCFDSNSFTFCSFIWRCQNKLFWSVCAIWFYDHIEHVSLQNESVNPACIQYITIYKCCGLSWIPPKHVYIYIYLIYISQPWCHQKLALDPTPQQRQVSGMMCRSQGHIM